MGFGRYYDVSQSSSEKQNCFLGKKRLPDSSFNITQSYVMGGVIKRTSISLPKELLEKGQKIARKRRRNFSNYVADLIASDCITRPVGSDIVQGKGEEANRG